MKDSGVLVPSFGVRCGMCQKHIINGIADGVEYSARTKTAAGRILRRAGWAYVPIWGWICPKCEKVGCGSKVAQIGARKALQNLGRASPPFTNAELKRYVANEVLDSKNSIYFATA